jgi:NADPH:quinone reductase-like Zn-dependent oxidoreductase
VSLFVSQRLTSLLSKERGTDVERLAELLASDQLTPSIDQTFPLERSPEAMSLLEAGRVRGKVALSVSGTSRGREG